MYFKLILFIFIFILIFINISIGKNYKCPKNGNSLIKNRRYKRGGTLCRCTRGDGDSRKGDSEGSVHGGGGSGRSYGSGQYEVTGGAELEEARRQPLEEESSRGGDGEEIVQEKSYGSAGQYHGGPVYEGKGQYVEQGYGGQGYWGHEGYNYEVEDVLPGVPYGEGTSRVHAEHDKNVKLSEIKYIEEEIEIVENIGKSPSGTKKKVLYICDNFFYSHDMIVYSKEEGNIIEANNFRIIKVPINKKTKVLYFVGNREIQEEYKQYKDSIEYFSIGIYEEVMTYKLKGERFFEWLVKQNYSFGIAEFEVMASSFAVFEALGIKNTFDVTNSSFIPEYFQFLKIDVDLQQVPG
uniref:Uncharacterized protein n=1 Tax=Meloidogyne hapla TaxID=6305 RepID=A0A1I8AXS1_MELHA